MKTYYLPSDILTLPLDSVTADLTKSIRAAYPEDAVAEMGKNLQEHGQKLPIFVDDDLKVVSGHFRWLGLKSIKAPTIRCVKMSALRNLPSVRPHDLVTIGDSIMEVISYPYPDDEDGGKIKIKKGDPTTMITAPLEDVKFNQGVRVGGQATYTCDFLREMKWKPGTILEVLDLRIDRTHEKNPRDVQVALVHCDESNEEFSVWAEYLQEYVGT